APAIWTGPTIVAGPSVESVEDLKRLLVFSNGPTVSPCRALNPSAFLPCARHLALLAKRQKGLYAREKSGHFYCVKSGHFYCNTTPDIFCGRRQATRLRVTILVVHAVGQGVNQCLNQPVPSCSAFWLDVLPCFRTKRKVQPPRKSSGTTFKGTRCRPGQSAASGRRDVDMAITSRGMVRPQGTRWSLGSPDYDGRWRTSAPSHL